MTTQKSKQTTGGPPCPSVRGVVVGMDPLSAAAAAKGDPAEPGQHGVTRLAPHRVAFRFGIISDVQYADINDATNYSGSERRSYRRALLGLKQSIDAWNGLAAQLTQSRTGEEECRRDDGGHSSGNCSDHPRHLRTGVSFVLQLGDLIDGQNSGTYSQGLEMEAPQTTRAMEAVRREVARCLCQDWRNVMGNHELLNYPKEEAVREVLSVGEGSFHAQDEEHPAYYSFHPQIMHPHSQALAIGQHEHANAVPRCDEKPGSYAHHKHHPVMGWRFIVLDSFDVGVIGREKEDPSYQEAARILNANNPNNVVDGDGSNWFKGLKGEISACCAPWLCECEWEPAFVHCSVVSCYVELSCFTLCGFRVESA